MLQGLAGAIQFLTRIPVRTPEAIEHHRVVPWLPAAGLLIGAIVGGVAAGAGELVPASVAATLAVITGILVTGAFHEDGLADVADAFGGGWTSEQRLQILKDSRHGTYGVAALSGSIVLRIVALASIASPAAMFAACVSAHGLGRGAAVVAMRAAPPATEAGLGVSAASSLRPVPTVAGLATMVIALICVAGWWTGPFIVVAAASVAAVVGLAIRKIGGLAGDVLGAVEQVAECSILVVASALATRSTIWWA